MAKLYYPAIIDKEGEVYGVTFPDLPGCVTVGPSAGEALRLAEDVVILHLEGLAREGQSMPPRSSLEDIKAHHASDEGIVSVALVGAWEPTASERVNVWLPKIVIEQIDRRVQDAGPGASRSGFITQAARQRLSADQSSGTLADAGTAVELTPTMLRERRRAAQRVAGALFEAEAAIDAALTKTAHLTGIMPSLRKIAGGSELIDREAVEHASAVIMALAEARRAIVETYKELTVVQQQIGLNVVRVPGEGAARPRPTEANSTSAKSSGAA